MNKQFVHIVLFRWLSIVLLPSQANRQSSEKNNKHQLLYPYGVPSDDGL